MQMRAKYDYLVAAIIYVKGRDFLFHAILRVLLYLITSI